MVWVGADYGLAGLSLGVVSFVTAIALGILMVSNIRYFHFVSALTARGQFATLVGVVFIIVLVLIAPVPFLFLFTVAIAASGPIRVGLQYLRGRWAARSACCEEPRM